MRALERVLGYVAAAALFAMMVLTFADVVGRKLFASIPGSLEVTELLMLVVIFLGLPLASLKGEHVFFDLLDQFLPEPLRRFQAVLSNGVCAALLLGAAWLVYVRAGRTVDQGDITAQLQIPVGPFQYGAAALLLLTGCVHVFLMASRPPPSTRVPPTPAAES
jgi:TRAP-type C4-dicarboxylate transport system permease small subunit